ncbi:MAG TPA: ribulose-phosphate 3-epimerase [Bacteroidia bacterium]|nr:ribulose-phosphate 3-epimerase [Bacteroidia bacterium]
MSAGIIVAPSLLSADFADLKSVVKMINESDAGWLHLDVMDGVFVPNISFGLPVIRAVKTVATKPLDVHLMIVNPEKYISDFRKAGADILTVHYEACTHLHRVVQQIKSEGMKAGVALNPHTSVEVLEDILADIDLVCMMSVNPGFGGQKFIAHTFEKISRLKDMVKRKKLSTYIEADGGVDLVNYKDIVAAGANVLVAGNTVFTSSNPKQVITQLNIKE